MLRATREGEGRFTNTSLRGKRVAYYMCLAVPLNILRLHLALFLKVHHPLYRKVLLKETLEPPPIIPRPDSLYMHTNIISCS